MYRFLYTDASHTPLKKAVLLHFGIARVSKSIRVEVLP